MNSLLLKRLCEADSIASHEDEVRKILYSELAKLSDEIFCDDLGSLIFYQKRSLKESFKTYVLCSYG